ncbi:hypothetical protein VSX64_24995 [Aurantimonas sp. C2-6-R+9]|nr:hypothetical protein [Aurantimonas sp. C2-6-R+9]
MQIAKLQVPVVGQVFIIGVGLLVFHLLTLGHRIRIAAVPLTRGFKGADAYGGSKHAIRPGWKRLPTGWEAEFWLLGMGGFGAFTTLGLLSFDLSGVRTGSPIFPYLMAGIGYPGLSLVTLLFVWRLLGSLTAGNVEPLAVYTSVTFAAEPAERAHVRSTESKSGAPTRRGPTPAHLPTQSGHHARRRR